MGLVQITGQVSRDTDQNTTNLLNQAIQFSDGQNELRKIKLEQKEEKRERAQKRQELEDIQYMQEKVREVEELKSKLRRAEHKNEVLRDLAADVILDRSSIRNTMAFLKNKWTGTPAQSEEFEQDFATARKAEKEKIEQDEDRQNKAYQLVDEVVSGWSHPSSTRRRRPPAAKKKATPPPLK